MKLSLMIERLIKAHNTYGDVDVVLLNSGNGHWDPAKTLIKIHPMNEHNSRIMDMTKPVESIGIMSGTAYGADLTIS